MKCEGRTHCYVPAASSEYPSCYHTRVFQVPGNFLELILENLLPSNSIRECGKHPPHSRSGPCNLRSSSSRGLYRHVPLHVFLDATPQRCAGYHRIYLGRSLGRLRIVRHSHIRRNHSMKLTSEIKAEIQKLVTSLDLQELSRRHIQAQKDHKAKFKPSDNSDECLYSWNLIDAYNHARLLVCLLKLRPNSTRKSFPDPSIQSNEDRRFSPATGPKHEGGGPRTCRVSGRTPFVRP